MTHAWIASTGLGLCLLLGACAPTTRVTLLPQADGKPSAVEVSTGKSKQLLAQPYQVANVARSGEITPDTTSADKVRAAYPQLIALQPLEPEHCVLNFEPNTTQLTAASQAELANVIARAQARAGGEIVVTGHTDRQGQQQNTEEASQERDKLSLERAQLVRTMLIERGFLPELIEAVGRGGREPLVVNTGDAPEPRNRRAEVVVR